MAPRPVREAVRSACEAPESGAFAHCRGLRHGRVAPRQRASSPRRGPRWKVPKSSPRGMGRRLGPAASPPRPVRQKSLRPSGRSRRRAGAGRSTEPPECLDHPATRRPGPRSETARWASRNYPSRKAGRTHPERTERSPSRWRREDGHSEIPCARSTARVTALSARCSRNPRSEAPCARSAEGVEDPSDLPSQGARRGGPYGHSAAGVAALSAP